MDRTKAAEILHKARVCYATEYLDCHMVCDMCKYHVEDSLVVEAIDTAIKALDKDIDAPSKWIPVSERLPQSDPEDLEYPTVIICSPNGSIELGCFYESTKEWGTGEGFDRLINPVAWMPLPEPYRGGEKE